MSKRYRIDFSIRELDVPEESARGIRFGDDVPVGDISDFFNKCRDAARSLFQPPTARRSIEELQKELDRLARERDELKERERKEAAHTLGQMSSFIKDRGIKAIMPQAPAPPKRDPYAEKNWDYDELMRSRDDGSRGGDGPVSAEWAAKVAAALNPNRGRY